MLITLRRIDNTALTNNIYIIKSGELILNYQYDYLMTGKLETNTTNSNVVKFLPLEHNHDAEYVYSNPNITSHLLNTNNPHGVTLADLELDLVLNGTTPLYKENYLADVVNKSSVINNLNILTSDIPVIKKSTTDNTIITEYRIGDTYTSDNLMKNNNVILLSPPITGSTTPLLPPLDGSNLINLRTSVSGSFSEYNGFRNLLINGDFSIRQGSSAIFANTDVNNYNQFLICDMWKVQVGNPHNSVDYCKIFRKLNDNNFISNAIKLGNDAFYRSLNLFVTSKANVHKELAIGNYCTDNNISTSITAPAYAPNTWVDGTSTLSTSIHMDPAVIHKKPLTFSFYYLTHNTVTLTTANVEISISATNTISTNNSLTLMPCTVSRVVLAGCNLSNTIIPTHTLNINNSQIYTKSSTSIIFNTKPTLTIVTTLTDSVNQITQEQIDRGYYYNDSNKNLCKFINPTSGNIANTIAVTGINGFWNRQNFTTTIDASGLNYNIDKNETRLNVKLVFNNPVMVSNIQLELGDKITEFENRNKQLELALCRRYMNVMNNSKLTSGSAFSFVNLKENDLGFSIFPFSYPLNNYGNLYYDYNKLINVNLSSTGAGTANTLDAYPLYTSDPIIYKTNIYVKPAATLLISKNLNVTDIISCNNTVYNNVITTPVTASNTTRITFVKLNSNLIFSKINYTINRFGMSLAANTDSRTSLLYFGDTITGTTDIGRSPIHSCNFSIIDPFFLR